MNYWQKYLVKKIIRLTPRYHHYMKQLKNFVDLKNPGISDSIKNIPYYIKNGYSDKQLLECPFLEKENIIGRENQFLSSNINKRFLIQVSTSGSTGPSLIVYKTVDEIIREEAFIQYVFSLIGKNLRIAVLRGNRPSSGIYEFRFGHLLLSSYHLSKKSVLQYLLLIKKYRINCLHVYPSAIQIFCKYLREILQEGKSDIPLLQGILSSSENLSEEVKNEILELFPNAILIDLYGQAEHVAFAISVNKGEYQFNKSYSTVELLDSGMSNGDNKLMEIVGTNTSNKAMPLIRYRTGDYVEVNASKKIVSVFGRSNDFVVNNSYDILPCIVIIRKKNMEKIEMLQYYQDKVGELIVRVKMKDSYSESDIESIEEDMVKGFGALIKVSVQIVEHFEKAKNGKHIRCVQKLDLKQFNNNRQVMN